VVPEAAVAVKEPGAEIVAAVTPAVTTGLAENTASAAGGATTIAPARAKTAKRAVRREVLILSST
jgi:hypothetical protein